MVKERDFGAEFDMFKSSDNAGKYRRAKESYNKGLRRSKELSSDSDLSFERKRSGGLINYRRGNVSGATAYENDFELGGIAKGFLDTAVENKNASGILAAVKMYNFMEKIDNASKSNVFNAFKKVYQSTGGRLSESVEKTVRDFLTTHPTKRQNIEKRVTSTVALLGIVGGLIFLSPALTGNIIGNFSNSTANWIGGILFLCGLIGAYFYFRRR